MVNWLNAGIARANLMSGKYDEALAAAQLVPAGFEKDAVYSSNSTAQNNNQFVQGNTASNRSYTIRGVWCHQIDTVSGSMKDWYSDQLDSRVPLQHDNNNSKGYNLGAGGVVKFFSNGKASRRRARQSRSRSTAKWCLIQAEVYWRKGQFQTAIDKMNINRAAAGLPNLVLPDDRRHLHVGSRCVAERAVRATLRGRLPDAGPVSVQPRRRRSSAPVGSIKLPLSVTEAINNPNITHRRREVSGHQLSKLA